MRKVVMIGVDAAELSFIEAHRSVLPTFDRLLRQGRVQRLASPAGILTGSVWPTFYTGEPPGTHGLYHHLQWDAERMRLRRVSAEWLYSEPFWYAFERRGLSVAAVDVQVAFPSRLTAGTEVMHWGNHDLLGSFSTQPPHLAAEIRRRFGRHPMGYEIPVTHGPAERERIKKDMIAGARLKAALSRWLLGLKDWDFFLTVFGETHRGGHILWPLDAGAGTADDGFGPLLDVYRAVDEGVGEVLAAAPADRAVMVFALHGMGPNTSQEQFVPAVLDRANELFAGNGSTGPGRPSDGRRPRRSPRQRSLIRRLRESVPPGVQKAIAQAVPVGVRDAVVDRQIAGGRDWAVTPGFALLADLNGYVRLNLRGREASGMLDPDGEGHRRYVDWIMRCFSDLRIAGTGEPLVEDVLLTRDAFRGSRAHHLPDVIVRWTGAPPAAHVRSDALGSFSARLATGRGGNHRPEGFCIHLDPGVTRGAAIPAGHILDLAPQVRMHLFGDPAPAA